ncbi:MAG: NAD(+)/NADH kinase [Verrucomicrobiota bacterium]|nr:NAD(+)/NADH kinase [Verrucomicrobiota bacterium]
MRPQTVGLIAHPGKPGVAELARAVVADFKRFSVAVEVENEIAALAKLKVSGTAAEVIAKSEIIVVLGGDGTLLSAVEGMGDNLKPVFGINVGSLGFLTCANSAAYADAVDAIATGRITYSQRVLLQVELRRGATVLSSSQALNDAVIGRGDLSRLIRLEVTVNGEALTEFNADGLIIATPTGSTAYSLSAGGPILAPECGAFVITPICPHVLTNRSVILTDSSVLEVKPSKTEYPTFLTLDGRDPVRIIDDAIIRIRRAPKMLQLGFLPGVSFFAILRQKLKWSGSNV